jgi:putative inorganic carbon (HCO3(-)) transporter
VLAALAPRALVPDGRGLARDPLALGSLLLLVSAVVSTALSRSPWTSLLGAHESYFGLTTLLAYAVLFFVTRGLCETAEDARRLLLAPLVGAAVAAVYALVQLGGMDPIRYGRTSGLGGFVRPFATLGHPNFLSAFLVMALPLVLYALVRGWRGGRRAAAVVPAAVAVLALVGTAVAVSRGAWLALVAAVLVLVAGALWAGERRAAAALGVAAGGAVAVVGGLTLFLPGPTAGAVLTGLLQRMRQLGDSASRQHIWQAAWRIFREHPLVGSGLDTFQIAFADQRTAAYWTIEWNASPTRAHNEALNLLATQGTLGALAVLVVAAGVVVATWRAWRLAGDRLLVAALVAGLAAFAVQDLFSFTVAGCGTLAVTQAALLSRLARSSAEPPPPPDGAGGFALTLGAVVLLVPVLLAHNVSTGPLLDEPARMAGVMLVLLALAVAVVAAWALAEPDAGPPPAGGRGRLAAPPPRPLHVAAGVVAAGLLLVVLVLRPLAAAWAAQEGVKRTPSTPASALEYLERAVRLDPFNELYWVKLGAAAHGLARVAPDAAARRRALERSRAAYERSIRLVPANSYNHANLARVLADLAREGDPSGPAFAAFDRALAMDPANAYFYADAANAALSLNDPERARAYAQRAVALYPFFGMTRAQLGYVALATRRPAEAIDPLRQALGARWYGADRAQALAASNLAAAYLQTGRPAEAQAAARTALEQAPTSPEARFNLAKALEQQGRRDEAVAEYRRLLAAQPDYTLARDALRALGDTAGGK